MFTIIKDSHVVWEVILYCVIPAHFVKTMLGNKMILSNWLWHGQRRQPLIKSLDDRCVFLNNMSSLKKT